MTVRERTPRGDLTMRLEPDRMAVCLLSRTLGVRRQHAQDCPYCVITVEDLTDRLEDWWAEHSTWRPA